MEIERRAFKIEVREDGSGTRFLAGTPIVYGKRSEDLGFYEYIAQGAATEALKRSDTRLLYGHNSDTLLPIARQKSGTLRSKEDKNGVHIEADPPKQNPFVTALIESIERGDVGEMSFGFTVEEDLWEDIDKDIPVRTIRKIGEIFDYSYVAYAAYNDTSVALRSLGEAKKQAQADDSDDKTEDKIVITAGDETFEFSGDDRFDRAADKINELRSGPSPTANDPDNADGDPTVNQPPDTDEDILARIKKTTERYKK